MKFNFKKISAIGASILMTGLTMGVAAAASFPAPFVDGGVANVAVVYGTGTGVSSLDQVQAGNIQTTLGESMPSTGTTTVTDGDSYVLHKTNNNFNLGNTITNIDASLDEDELGTLLAEGTYEDSDNDEFDYEQSITLSGTPTLTFFADSDYLDEEPSYGLNYAEDAHVLNYTISFKEQPTISEMNNTDLTILGKEYRILKATATKLTLLDSATSTSIDEGEVKTIGGKAISVTIGTDWAKFTVDGETTSKLEDGGVTKLDDGSYLGVKEILYSSRDVAVNSVEISIGTGKLIIEDDKEIELNSDNVEDVTGWVVESGTKLDSIVIKWNAKEKMFLAGDEEMVMPGFEAVKLSFGGMNYPSTMEEFSVEAGNSDKSIVLDNFALKGTTEDIFVLSNTASDSDTAFTIIGKKATENLLTSSGIASITFNDTRDEWFIASYKDDTVGESYLLRFNDFDKGTNTSSAYITDDSVDVEIRVDGEWASVKSDVKVSKTFTVSNLFDVTIDEVNSTAKTVAFTTTESNANFNQLYSAEGLTVMLPYANITQTYLGLTVYADDATAIAVKTAALADGEFYTGTIKYNKTGAPAVNTTTSAYTVDTFNLVFLEEDKDAKIKPTTEERFTVNLSTDAKGVDATIVATANDYGPFDDLVNDDKDHYTIISDLGTKLIYDATADQKAIHISYAGEEVFAEVRVSSADATLTSDGASSLGDVLVTDAEIDNVKDKNLIIVGGSCINTAAATVLGGAYCGAAFTEATNVGPGQFLIKAYDGAFTEGKIALVVAGYEAADTVNAATYLRTQTVDTSSAYVGTSSTAAELIVA